MATTKLPTAYVGPDEKGSSTQAAQQVEYFDPKKGDAQVQDLESSDQDSDHHKRTKPPSTARDLVTEILLVEDDPTLNPWTFRMWFIGIGMSVFAG
jgi:hypothetical protein